MNKIPDIDVVYEILRGWAVTKQIHCYSMLSLDYQNKTGVAFPPHGSWDAVLQLINERLHTVGAPALSALVVNRASSEPGGCFWGCAPNVPQRPATEMERLAEWARIVRLVHSYSWGSKLP